MNDQAKIEGQPEPIEAFPAGEYAIVELMGHQTVVGRIAEVERFGAKFCAIEPIYLGKLLPPIFQGGPSIYRMTPCSAEIAFDRGAKDAYHLPTSVRATLPKHLLPAPASGRDHDRDVTDVVVERAPTGDDDDEMQF